jgi:hypothetical protein
MKKKGERTMANEIEIIESPTALQKIVSPEVMKAIQIFETGKVPPENIRKHPGKGDKIFYYISHVWATKQLNAAFGQLWSMDLPFPPQVLADGSAFATVKLTIAYPRTDRPGEFFYRYITDTGNFDAGGGKMSYASMMSSAVSRALVKTMFRAFNIGSELYEAETPMTKEQAWTMLKKRALKYGKTEEEVVEVFKREKITADNLIERFGEAYHVINVLIGQEAISDIPDSLD